MTPPQSPVDHTIGYERISETRFRFIQYTNGTLKTVWDEAITGPNDERVCRVARSYRAQGMALVSLDWRTVDPARCLCSGLTDGSGTIILVSWADVNADVLSWIEQAFRSIDASTAVNTHPISQRQRFRTVPLKV